MCDRTHLKALPVRRGKVDIDNLLKVAALARKLNRTNSGADGNALQRGLDGLRDDEKLFLQMVCKLSEGRPFSITSDNPDCVEAARDIAREFNCAESSRPSALFPDMTETIFLPARLTRG